MKLMQVSFNIDVCNAAHVAALHHFMNVLGEHTATAPVVPIAPPAEPKKTRAVKATAPTPTEEPESTSELIDETTVKTEEPKDETAVSTDLLRTMVSTLIRSNSELREVIKAKLDEFTADSVSKLAVKHYDAFYKFLKTIS